MKIKQVIFITGSLLSGLLLTFAALFLSAQSAVASQPSALDAPEAVNALPKIADFESGIPTGMGVFSDRLDGAAGGRTLVTATTTIGDLPTILPITDTTSLLFEYDLIINDWGYAYGGLNHSFSATQDWSNYDGFSFWFYGSNTGNTIELELWDGGTSGPTSERFEQEFVDDVAGWRLFKVDFSDFEYATDYQPNPANGILDLNEMWGYNFGIVTSPSSGEFIIDNVELYSYTPLELIVDFSNETFLVGEEDGSATITLTLNSECRR